MTVWAGTEPVDVDCRHAEECDGCAHVYVSCQVEGCWSPDVTARFVAIGRGRTLRVLLCDTHGALESPRLVPFGVANR